MTPYTVGEVVLLLPPVVDFNVSVCFLMVCKFSAQRNFFFLIYSLVFCPISNYKTLNLISDGL